MNDLWIIALVVALAVIVLVVFETIGKMMDSIGALAPRKDTIPDKVMENLFYIRGILRNRFNGQINDLLAMELLVVAFQRGTRIEIMTAHAKGVKSWDVWVKDMRWDVDDEDSAFAAGEAAIHDGGLHGLSGGLFSDDD